MRRWPWFTATAAEGRDGAPGAVAEVWGSGAATPGGLPLPEVPITGPEEAAASSGVDTLVSRGPRVLACRCCIAASTSPLVIRPPRPVPGTSAAVRLASASNRAAAGEGGGDGVDAPCGALAIAGGTAGGVAPSGADTAEIAEIGPTVGALLPRVGRRSVANSAGKTFLSGNEPEGVAGLPSARVTLPLVAGAFSPTGGGGVGCPLGREASVSITAIRLPTFTVSPSRTRRDSRPVAGAGSS